VRAAVVSPIERELIEIVATRTPGPPSLVADSKERVQRVRAALANAGFSVALGRIEVVVPDDAPSHDLAVALAVLLSDPAHKHLRRFGWLAWGVLGLDGSVTRGEGPFVGGLHSGPAAGRIWQPDDRLPEPDDDAVISVVEVETIGQAWDVFTSFVSMEQVIFEEEPRMHT